MRRLKADETIATVWNYLTHKRPYGTGVFQKLRQCEKVYGNASVRIGVTGTGQKPYYRVFYTDEGGTRKIFNSFYDNHEPLEDGFAITQNWSTASMTTAELETFLKSALELGKP